MLDQYRYRNRQWCLPRFSIISLELHLGWGRSANTGAVDTTAQEFPLGVSQILCKHHRAVKNRARIIYWGGGLSATPCIVSDIGDAVSSTNYQCRLVVSRI